MKWHPEALKFPRLEGDEREALKASLRSTKGNKESPILYRVHAGDWQGLDGITREELCKELKLKPTYKRVEVDDDQVKHFILRRNLFRRHMTKDQRQPFIDDMAKDGFNNCEIAAVLGVDEKTVRRSKGGKSPQTGCLKTPESRANSSGNSGVSSANAEIKTKLVDELKDHQFSPKIEEKINALPPGKQKDLAKLIPLHGITKAYQMVSDQRDPGDEAKPPKSGAEVFNFKVWDASFGVVARGPDDVKKVYPDMDKDKHSLMIHHLSKFRELWDQERKRLTKSNV